MVVRTKGQVEVEALGNGGYTSAGPSSVGGKRESWEVCESCTLCDNRGPHRSAGA